MEPTRSAERSDTTTGWLFVAIQAVLLIALVALPGADHWNVPSWLHALGLALLVAGMAMVAIAALRLGPALTPTPVPNETGALATTGLYRLARHPIYTGVLIAVIGVAIRSGNLLTLAVAGTTVVFFNTKAAWEERRLAERYPEYPAYAAQTPRFVPRPWR